MAENQMIKFDYNGTTYVLEFDRESAVRAERMYDISMSELQSGKSYLAEALFAAALAKHHPKMKSSTAKTLFDLMEDKVGLYTKLTGMYAAAAGSLLDDPSDEGKAITWSEV